MDTIIHWGVLRHSASEVNARAGILVTVIALDVVVLITFLFIKGKSDSMIFVISIIGISTFAVGRFKGIT